MEYQNRNLYEIDISLLQPDPLQPRKFMDNDSINELSNSIKELGLLQPIIFRLNEAGEHTIVAGERRWEAAKRAGYWRIPAIYIQDKTAEIALVENIQRQNLTPIEEAEAFQRIMNEFGYDQDGLCKVSGKAKSTILEILSLNKLPDEVKNDCRCNSDVSRRKLIEIAKEKDSERMIKTYEKYKASGLSKDELRKMRRSEQGKDKTENKIGLEQIINNLNLIDKKFQSLDLDDILITDNKQEFIDVLSKFISRSNELIAKLTK